MLAGVTVQSRLLPLFLVCFPLQNRMRSFVPRLCSRELLSSPIAFRTRPLRSDHSAAPFLPVMSQSQNTLAQGGAHEATFTPQLDAQQTSLPIHDDAAGASVTTGSLSSSASAAVVPLMSAVTTAAAASATSAGSKRKSRSAAATPSSFAASDEKTHTAARESIRAHLPARRQAMSSCNHCRSVTKMTTLC